MTDSSPFAYILVIRLQQQPPKLCTVRIGIFYEQVGHMYVFNQKIRLGSYDFIYMPLQ